MNSEFFQSLQDAGEQFEPPMSGEDYESDEGSELGFGEGERVNTYCSQSQVMEDFSDDEEAIPTAIAPKTMDPEASAKSVGASYTALKKSTATFLASVAVNMFVMDSCAEGEDEELRLKAKNVTQWVIHMKELDSEFPDYDIYR